MCSRMKGEPGVIGIVPVSGIFDLRPIGQVYVNDVVGMDDAQIMRHSPLLHPAVPTGFAIVAHGADEHLNLEDLRKATEVVSLTLLELLNEASP